VALAVVVENSSPKLRLHSEIQQQSDLKVRSFQIIHQLSLMFRSNGPDCFQFNDYFVIDSEIRKILSDNGFPIKYFRSLLFCENLCKSAVKFLFKTPMIALCYAHYPMEVAQCEESVCSFY
jgi:hypothetical protein